MNQEENFDDLIRQKFDEKEFVFNDENWEKAEKKIDAVRRLSKIYLWTSIFIVGLIIGVGLTLLLVGNKKSENTKNVSELNLQKDNKTEILSDGNSGLEKSNSELSSDKLKENTVSKKEEEKQNSLEEKSGLITNDNQNSEKESKGKELSPGNIQHNIPASLNKANKELLSPKNIGAGNENTGSNKEAKLIANKTSNPNNQILKKAAKGKSGNEVSKKGENNNSVKEKKSQINNNATILNELTSSERVKDKSKSSGTEDVPEQDGNNINSDISPSTQVEKNIQKNNNDLSLEKSASEGKLENEVPAPAVFAQNEGLESNIVLKEGNQAEKNSQKYNPDVSELNSGKDEKSNNEPPPLTPLSMQNAEQQNDSAANYDKTTELLQQISTEIVKQKVDSSVQINLTAAPPVVPSGLASATFFSIEAGTNLEIGWQYGEATEGGGFNPILGIGVSHYFNQKWSLYSGVQYGSIAYLKVSKKSFSDVSYGFGSITVDTVIDTKYLHYAVVPFMFQYSFNDKNAISIGGSISYLLNSKSKVTINTTTVSAVTTDSNEVSSTAKSELGYYANAFNKWDASLAIGYRRRISQRFNVAAITNFGLADIKNNEFFTRDTFERNIGLKITLSYNLFDF